MASTIAPPFPPVHEPGIPTIVPVESLPQITLREVIRGIPNATSRILPAWIMLGVCLVLSTGMLIALTIAAIGEGLGTDLLVFIVWGPLFTCCAVTGVLILQKYPGHWVGWVMCLAGVTLVTTQATYVYGMLGLDYSGWGLPATSLVLQAGFFYPLGLYLLLVELPLIFPSGRLSAPWWQGARIFGVLGALVASYNIGFGQQHVMFGQFGDIANPWHVAGAVTELTDRINGFNVIFAMGIPAAISMIVRLRRATGVERMQLRWIAWDAVIVIFAYTLHAGPWIEAVDMSWIWVPVTMWGLALNSLAIVVGISILKLRLYDIDVVIHRSLLYITLIAIIGALYLALTFMVNIGAQRINAGDPNPWLASLVVASAVALVVQPVRTRVEEAFRRRLFGSPDGERQILARLGVRLEAAMAPSDVLNDVTRSIMEVLRLPHAAVAMSMDGSLDLVAEAGTPGAVQLGIPMVYRHEQIGELRVTPRSPDDGFSPGDREILESVARQTAVAAYAMRVSADLQLARERLVTAREEERRRLRRDLHDGLGAQLAGLTIQTGAIKRLVRREPVRAEAELDHLQTELRAAIADVRRLVHGLRPPALDEFGLITALRSRLLAFEGDGFCTNLVASGERHTLPAAVEVAIYRITEEALTNIDKHAAARSATVVLEVGTAVRLDISDDGRGIDAEPRVGVGFQSMRERTEELGGAFEVESRPGEGTRILVTIPLQFPEVA